MTNSESSSQKSDNQSLSMTDLVQIQDDIRKVVDINKPDDELTPEQLVKKILYNTAGKFIEKNMGKDFTDQLENQRKQVDQISILQSNFEKLTGLGREIEKTLTLQLAGLAYHFDHGDENYYRKTVDGMTTDTINDKGASAGERIKSAQKILSLIEVYREKMLKDLQSQQDKIHDLLSGFEKRLKETPFDFFKDNEDIFKAKPQFDEWLELSWKLYKSREKAISAVNDHIDADEIIPNHMVSSGGDVTQNISPREIRSKMERVVTLTAEADAQEKEIAQTRSKISENLFGKAENYTDLTGGVEKQSTIEEKPTDKKMGTMTKWLIVIVLSIVALSWGIWTAIGVFILGMIMINVLSK